MIVRESRLENLRAKRGERKDVRLQLKSRRARPGLLSKAEGRDFPVQAVRVVTRKTYKDRGREMKSS